MLIFSGVKGIYLLLVIFLVILMISCNSLLTGDTTGPQLLSYSMDMISRNMILTFDEDIETSSLDVSGITIQATPGVITNTSLYYRLTSVQSVLVDVANVITIELSNVDFNALQSRLGVATSRSNTFLTMDATTVTDRSARRNMAQPISAANALPVSTFIADTFPPVLLHFSLDLNAGTMTLTFSEPVLIESFSPQLALIASRRDSTVGAYRLTGGIVANSNTLASSVVVISFSDSDLLSIKLDRNVATGFFNTYLFVSSGFVTDVNHNNNTASNGLAVSRFIPDTTPPELVAFDFDLNRGVIVLTFNDLINVSSFNATAITLQSSSASQEMDMYTIIQSSTSSPNGLRIVADLSSDDVNIIKMIPTLCTAVSNCFITVTHSVATDLNGLSAVPIPNESALPVAQFTDDTTEPELISWDLNINDGELYLVFSETVNASTADPTQLTLQSSSEVNGFTETVSLTDSTVISISNPAITIILSLNDLNAIKRFTNLGTDHRNSFLSFSAALISDTSGNPVVPIPSSLAVLVDSFIPDMTPPFAVSFSINITSGILSMTFSETVNISSFNFSGLTLLNRTAMNHFTGDRQPVSNYTLTGGTLQSQFDDSVVVVALSQRDLDAIIAINNLATSATNTYLAATSRTIRDTARIQLYSISLLYPLQVSEYGKYMYSTQHNIYNYHTRVILNGCNMHFLLRNYY